MTLNSENSPSYVGLKLVPRRPRNRPVSIDDHDRLSFDHYHLDDDHGFYHRAIIVTLTTVDTTHGLGRSLIILVMYHFSVWRL